MALVIYNSQTRTKEEFKPLAPPQVKMYVCGPTVYDLLHVGNFRGPIFFNLVRNWLDHSGYKVNYVFNFTDVDDKIINRANEQKSPPQELAEKYIGEFLADYNRLGLRKHDLNPKVTESMPEIIQMISELIEKKKAYVTGGDVNYSIPSFETYGKLSNRNTEELLTGVRVEAGEKKNSPLDFALWKHAKPGEPSWPSPWGEGRPGWHIECSAMIRKHLGETIDIHGGGMDLIFPHHENEIAQSEGCTGKPFVRYWMHNNMINFGGAKMSKSLGNIRTARSFMDQYTPEVFKFLILSSHYRSVSDLSEESVDHSISGLARIYSALYLMESVLASAVALALPHNESSLSPGDKERLVQLWSRVETALDDDFNTAEVMAVIFDQVRAFNGVAKHGMKANVKAVAQAVILRAIINRVGPMMSLFQQGPSDYLRSLDDLLLAKKGLQRASIDAKVLERAQARADKNFAESDRLRNELTALGVSVSDTPEGSFWEVTK